MSTITPELLTSAEVAALFGVTATTVKRWADAKLLKCEKTLGKHRRFARAEVERFKRAYEASPQASKVAEEWVEDWLVFLRETRSPSAIEARLLQMHARLLRWDLVCDELGELVCEIGLRWSRGELSILEEHLMSERLSRALSRLAEWLPRSPDHPRALLAVPDSDEHTLGLALTELCFRERAWETLWLGQRTPLSSLPAEIARLTPGLGAVALSASAVSQDAKRLAKDVTELEGACAARGVLLVLGGRGAWPERPVYARRIDTFSELGVVLDSLKSAT